MVHTKGLYIMWKKVVLVAILLLVISSAYADTGYEAEGDYAQDKGSYPKVTQIENKLYSKSYEGEDIYKRLDRLENSIFHKSFPTNDLATRVDNIADKTQYSSMPGYLVNNIALLEKANFDKVFKDDSPDARLERLEYHLIGAVQDGNYKDRIFKLKSLDDQNNVSEYLDDSSHAYDDSYPTNHELRQSNHRAIRAGFGGSTHIKDILLMVAPFLFGLL